MKNLKQLQIHFILILGLRVCEEKYKFSFQNPDLPIDERVDDIIRPADAPIRNLAAFKRIHLKAGESKVVDLNIRKEAFQTFDTDFNLVNIPGEFMISKGSSSAKDRLKGGIEVK
jgi:hypothetical protein